MPEVHCAAVMVAGHCVGETMVVELKAPVGVCETVLVS